MATRYDILTPRKKYNQDGVWWHKIGTAFEGREGGMNCELDSLPVPDAEGKVKFVIREAKDLRAASGTGQRQAPPRRADDEGDSIPF